MRFVSILFLILIFASCKNEVKNNSASTPAVSQDTIMTEPNGGNGSGANDPGFGIANSIQDAHHKNKWDQQRAIAFDVSVKFGGEERMNSKVTYLTNSSKIRLDKKDGSKLIYDGENVFLCPSDSPDQGARFDMFTWQYFSALPFKLTDPGTKWELLESERINDTLYNKAKLTFDKNTGDAPDDWYVVYQNAEDGKLHAAAYIVTFNGDKQNAEQNPHAIVYSNYEEIEGVPFATHWTFYNWYPDTGFGEVVGEANLSNIVFFEAENDLFVKPENSKKITR